MKPNIFDISTKELSQDAFITWLLQWADNETATYDKDLNNCGKDFVKELICKELADLNEEITIVKAGRQWENIDVWAEVNNKYLIIIEDKTYTGQHSGQLSRYKKTAENWCNSQSPKYNPPICIYLKTGNESQQSLDKVLEEGFKIYNRQEFISLLQKHELKNNIYNDFKTRLIRIEQVNNEWENKLISEWNGNDWQGFFQYLEKKINILGWSYVNNPNGGFWNAVISEWLYFDNYVIYLQSEQEKLCFKICTDPEEVDFDENEHDRSELRNRLHSIIIGKSKEKNLTEICKPDRFGTGKYMTVAVVNGDVWLGSKNEKINKEKVVKKLTLYKDFLINIMK